LNSLRNLALPLILTLLFGQAFAQKENPFVKKTELNQHWQFKRAGGSKWLQATVPGCVHTDLLNNKQIEDPFFGENEKKVQWIENEDWEYQCSFVVDSTMLNFQHIELVFEGLDTYASMMLNGIPLLQADNMFCTWSENVTKRLKKGTNTIFIRFSSPVRLGKLKAMKLPYTLPGDEKVFTRKAAYHFGWDWGPRLVTTGVWKPVYLFAWNDFVLRQAQIQQQKLTPDSAILNANLEIESTQEQNITIKISDTVSGEVYSETSVKLFPGINEKSISFLIHSPKLWWTNGLGKPFLYNIQITLNKTTTERQDTVIRTGLRKLEIIRQTDSTGNGFYVQLNGVPIFMKGANYIPSDNFLARTGKETYSRIIQSAKQANMNMLRVWGGGIYENDEFYNLCDENGILVWQDFMFACSMYPGDSAFVENVKAEAIDNITRLRNHPCLALWCGNNEMSEGWHNWGWQKQYRYSKKDSANIWHNYQKIFEEMLPALVYEFDSGRYYHPSSPTYGWGRKESLTHDDSHYWGVWWGMEPFSVYRKKIGHFMSEYGFQGFPSMQTIDSFTSPTDRFLYSDVLKVHQKHQTGFETIQTYLERDYRQPKDFESYTYVSQLLQAEGMRTAIEAHRRAKPYCMGTLYWQLNDCWPVVSWSSVDYLGRWKALHYFAKKTYENVILSTVEEGGKVNVYAVSDRLQDLPAKLELKLMDFDGKVYKKIIQQVNVPANSSKILFTFSADEYIDSSLKNNILLQANLSNDDAVIAKNIFYFLPIKKLNLPNPEISYTIVPHGDGFQIKLKSKNLVKNAFLSLSKGKGFFSDNYFDILPGEEIIITYHTQDMIENIDKKIKIASVFSSY